MSSESDAAGKHEKRSRTEFEISASLNEDCENTRNKRCRLEATTSLASTLPDDIQTSEVSGSYRKHTSQEPGKATPTPEDSPQNVHSSSRPPTPTKQKEEIVITNIRATDVALGLRRLPAGFYIVVRHSDLEWRTENKRSSVTDDVVEWDGLIPVPSDLSATVCLEVHASFEFQPVLGEGEQLRKLTITVEKLLDRSARHVPFFLFPKDGDIISPCSSILVTLERQESDSSNSSVSKILNPLDPAKELQGELEKTTNRGHSALLRYRKHKENRDLEFSAEQFERALNVCPLDHPCRAAAQSNLAMAKFILCQVQDTDPSLEVPLSLYRSAAAARSVGHFDRPSTLIQLAAVHLARFKKRRDEAERALAETLLQEAMELSSTDGHENRVAAFMLQLRMGRTVDPSQAGGQPSMEQDSASLFTDEDPLNLSFHLLHRFERFGGLADLQQAITLMRKMVQCTPIWDDGYCGGLTNLGVALSYRFDCLGELSDLEEAISAFKKAVDHAPRSHHLKHVYLTNLGNSLKTRFERLGELSDLMDAISMLRDAVELTPHGHPDRHARLTNLGSSLFVRFQRFGELGDLEDALSRQRDAVNLIPHNHPHMPACLGNFGSSLFTRFQHLGELSDLEDAILKQRDAVVLTPLGHPLIPGHLNNLGNSLKARFERLGELRDLDDAISRHRDALNLTPHGHPQKPGLLENLGTSFAARFQHLGEPNDLEDSVSMFRNAVDLTPRGHPDMPARLNNLGITLVTRFERLGELGNLEGAILILRNAVSLTPRGHPHMPAHLSSLASSLFARFQRLGELSDLEDVISRHRDAIYLTPDGHPDKPGRLTNLGNSFLKRFQCLGELSDLEDALSRQRDAVDLTSHDHPQKPHLLDSLGISFVTRFQCHGELSDLNNAISMFKDAVDCTPLGHPEKPVYLNNLGNSYAARFECLGEPSDLQNAISRHRDAVDLSPDGHSDKPTRLNNLGSSILRCFERLGEMSDLHDAIVTLSSASILTPHDHPDRPACLNNLANSFRARFERLGEPSDLDNAILMHRKAIDLVPQGNPDKVAFLTSLGNSLLSRFGRTGELSDVEDAISMLRHAVDLTPHGHSQMSSCLDYLGNTFKARFERFGESTDLEHAISLYSHAACIPIGPIGVRFRASQSWISCARRIRHHSLLLAYFTATTLFPQLAWVGLSVPLRYSQLKQGADVVREAAAAALDSGLPETAVEWLERGRSVVWGRLLELRSSYEELASAHPRHACRLRELSTALDEGGATREKYLSALLEQTQSAARHAYRESLQQEVDKQHALAIERDRLLQEIRGLPGFERFLIYKDFSQLRASAHSGPVVILNVADSRCDALIILADVDHPVHVPLPDFSFRQSTDLQNLLKSFTRHARAVHPDERDGQSVPWERRNWESFLAPLWKCVVKPVLDALAFSTPGDLSRIFWCPTGPLAFLPIHAAGFYDDQYSQPGHKVYDFVISSYVPALSVLSLPSDLCVVQNDDELRILAVRQPPSDGLLWLPGVHTELEHVRDVIKNSPAARTTFLESSAGTVEEVLSLMKEADWVHFACHGVQDAMHPTESGLCLANERRLKLRDIITLSRPRRGLAFLSACQTATGEQALSDEAIHIAAGMLFAGYGGVIGTMWSISDKIAPVVARNVYQHLFQNGTRPDYREAAGALHEAIGWLRESSEVPFEEWIPFIHVGL